MACISCTSNRKSSSSRSQAIRIFSTNGSREDKVGSVCAAADYGGPGMLFEVSDRHHDSEEIITTGSVNLLALDKRKDHR